MNSHTRSASPIVRSFVTLTDGAAPDVDALGICLSVLGDLRQAERDAVLAYLNKAPWTNRTDEVRS